MRDWNRVPIAAGGGASDLRQQQQQYVLPHELQQMLAARNLAAASSASGVGHFLGISREPMSPPPPVQAPPQPQHQQQHFVRDHHAHLQYLAHNLHANPPPHDPPASSSFKHLLSSCSVAMARIPSDLGQQHDHPQRRQESDRGDHREDGSGEWPSDEARALIKVRGDMESSFQRGAHPHLWEEISRKLGAMGYMRSGKNCKEKFESIVSYFRKTKEGNGGEDTGYRFFEELEALYGSNSGLTMGATTTEFHKEGNNGNHNRDSGVGTQQLASALAQGVLSSRDPEGDCSEQRENHNNIIDHATTTTNNNSNFDVNSSSESSAEYDEPGGGTSEYGDHGKNVKKRKRKSWKERMAFFENLVKKFMEKQEQMQQNFLELLEKREQERMKRDETWRKQEVARLNREYELRVEEHTRRINYDTALASALQKATGQVLEMPHQGPVPSPYSNTLAESNDDHHKEVCDSMNKRWPRAEVQALIQLRAAMETKFQEVGPKGPFWEEISAGLACQGYSRSAKRCKEKWENINKYYRKTSTKKRPENTKTCPYFQELDVLYQKGIIGTPSASTKSGQQNNNSGGNTATTISNVNNTTNNSKQLDETTDELDESNRDDSGGVQGEAEVLSIMPSAEATPTNAGASAVGGGLFSSPENCAHNTESSKLQSNSRSHQKRGWIDSAERHTGSLGLSFDAVQGAELLCGGSSTKALKFDGFKNLMDQRQQHLLHHRQQQQQQRIQQQGPPSLMMQERQSQEFQEAESSATTRGLVEGFALVDGLGRR
ncbi:trihelix transcription factor GT-2-like [Selaginella moellendorffii]|uniref:trihelix transcription factor GT-2-like n=1 Tax=Selaginella moellendorffii TaxID=88036 RepID=UPI000D1CBD2B|nr:trihelix transcription factor GT-2-like [Selaginella moellendorffii]XP_024527164.1 trihelix transcription factor GT-2-like [Selaginella moellendorffii]|eukprot:XP_024527162.1 trihelix transcription factor GT-2-like [Selaginella moellendorffii]